MPGDIVIVSFKQDSSMIAQVTRFCIMPGDTMPQVATSPGAPERGMSKYQVEQAYGAPQSIEGPIGSPPIYRWDYPGYSVYFEQNYVLHSVVFTGK